MPRVLRTALVVIALVVASSVAFAKVPPPPPAPTRWVTDTAGLLSADARTSLDTRLETYQKTTGHQVIVWIAPTLGDENLEEWSARVFTAWGIGQKGKDDGVALFVFPKDKALRIEVGYGLEDKLPDLYAKRIIDEAVTPQLVAGHNDVAIQNGVDQILARLGGDPATANVAPLPAQAPAHGGGLSLIWIVVLVIGGIGVLIFAATHPTFAWFLFDIITSMGNSGGSGWGGGGGGGGGGFSGGGGRSGGGGASGHW